MTKHNEFIELFYDLVLKKSLNLSLKSIECYLELSNQGKTLSIVTTLMQSKPGLIKLILQKLPYFKTQNLLIDNRNNQLIITKKYDFSMMSPDLFSLTLVQFHSEVMKYRLEIQELDRSEGVMVSG